MANIHATAVVDPNAELAPGVDVGPFCVVGAQVRLGDGVVLHSNAVITGRTSLGDGCQVFPFASIGHAPQDQKYHGEASSIEVGAKTVIREHVTISPGTKGGGMVTRIGSHCLLMVGAHVAHDCHIGDHVILVNNATLAGHVAIGDHAILGGLCAVHQFVRIGAYGFVGGMSGVERDVIPFGMVLGNRAYLSGLNIVGLKRHGFPREQIHELRQAYRMLFSSEGTLMERLEDVENMFSANPLVQQVIEFIKSHSDRSFCVPNNNVPAPSQS
jgi:UDP-N-acetylglucosamine acyltransferase